MSRILHVSPAGSDSDTGSTASPLRTISRAAELALPGDTVLVHEGKYREWVRPPRGGISNLRRITYAAAEGERVVISGSEPVVGWEADGVGGVWRADIPNEVFREFNPFAVSLFGDWLVRPDPRDPSAPRRHLGAVYLDGQALLEAPTRGDLESCETPGKVLDDWTRAAVSIADPRWAARRWFARVRDDITTVWANFGEGVDPRAHLVEVNVRPAVFFPERHHIDWITVRGFELVQAATQWAPPTAEQPGLIGPNWAKGWVIEDNVIHDSKCSGISLGKESSTGQNFAATRRDKPGYIYQLESVFSARQIGWDKEHVGSHVVRRNRIFNCGQTGIVGHLGAVFSLIEDNEIHDIATRREFFGHEIAGIKFHAAIDTVIRHNHIHHCTLGTWLDWETQGTRISRNTYHDNCRDLFVEVSHGPYLVDNNVFGSSAAIEVVSGGGAYVHNLIAGTVRLESVMDRATPYHRPHSTQVAGYSVIPGGDDRWVGNLFLGGDSQAAYGPGFHAPARIAAGTVGYEGYPASLEEYMQPILAASGAHDHDTYYGRKLPAYIRHNVYTAGARPFSGETGATVLHGEAALSISTDDGEDAVVLEFRLPEGSAAAVVPPLTGSDLECSYFANAEYEEPDGSPAAMDTDVAGDVRPAGASSPAGPLRLLREGVFRVRVW